MGLDQFLYRSVIPDLPFNRSDAAYELADAGFGGIKWGSDDDDPRSYVNYKLHLQKYTNAEEVMYWRKFNALHLWVENVAFDGMESNCDEIPLSLEQLAGLKVTCERILADPSIALENLPTGGRFFFGSTLYDAFYMQDVHTTLMTLTKLLAEEEAWVKAGNRPRQFIYWSSW